MTYFYGDIHGNPKELCETCERIKVGHGDVLILLGDVGANYYGNKRDKLVKEMLDYIPPTILCIHGNHEQRPENIDGYELIDWNGGKVWVQPEYPSILFARDGDIYTIGKYRYLVIGGAYSVDKFYRLKRGYGWWEDEQPSAEIKAYAMAGTTELWLNVTYNYSKHYYRSDVFGEKGIRSIYGLTGAESIPVLERAISALGDDVASDYWLPTEGNAKRPLTQLLAMAQLRLDGVWKGD